MKNQFAAQLLLQLISLVGGGHGEYGPPKGAVSAEVSWAALAVCHYLMVNPSVSGGGSSTGLPARWQIEMDFVVATM